VEMILPYINFAFTFMFAAMPLHMQDHRTVNTMITLVGYDDDDHDGCCCY